MPNAQHIKTEELLSLLYKEDSLNHFLQQNESAFQTPSFAQYMTDWCIKNNKVPEQIILKAGLDKSFGHQLFNGKRNPSRDTVLQFAFAIKAEVSQAQEMLGIAGKSLLYPRIRRDTVIIYCLHNHISLIDTNLILYDMNLPLLGRKNK